MKAFLLEKKTRRAAAVVVFVVVGLFSSVAFGSFVAAAEPTATMDATATSLDETSTDNGMTTTDTFFTNTTSTLTALETMSTDEGTTTSPSFFPTTTSSSDSTTSPDPSLSYYLVKFVPFASASEQEDVIAAVGATDLSRIAPLNLHSISVPNDGAQAAVAALNANSIVARVDNDRSREASGAASDPAYGQQWSLPRIGWDNLHGNVTASSSATVAVLDTGVDATHEDLQGQLVAGTSILDGSDGTTDPNGHGTEMAGIVAAATDNNTGIAGVGYDGVKVMPVTVLGADGTGQDSDVIAGVVWAVQHNADVILMSFSNPGFSQSLQDAIDYAWANNVVIVAATGNDSSSAPQFPAGDRGVVGVSNTDNVDNLNASSNYGDDTFLAAPGTGILTTTLNNSYVSITGTSAAAAIVAGAAGLMRATSISAASNGVIVSRLARNADAAGTATQTGNGRLNLGRAALDTSSDSIEPAGAAPIGGGGPFVGPYVIAAVGLNAFPATTLDGGSTTDVASGATISAVVSVTTSGNGAANTLGSIGWRISTTAPGTVTCVDVADVANNTTATRTLNITAPASNGIYNAYFIGYQNNTCSQNPTSTLTMTNGVVVGLISCGGNLICINGNLGDWKALTTSPSYSDFTGDQGGGSGDIRAIRVTAANNNLYVRWDETLQPNDSLIKSDGFSITIDANRDGTPDHRGWVMFNSSGVATTQVQTILGNTFINSGSAQQTCNFVPCAQGGAVSIEASFPLSDLGAPQGGVIGLQTETRSSSSTNSNVKDCVPGNGAPVCNGFFSLDTDTGTTTVDNGHATTTTLACPETIRNLNQSTSNCTITVTDTGFDTSTPPVAVTKANPTGTVNLSVSNGSGAYTPLSCTLAAKPLTTDQSTCTVTYTPTTFGPLNPPVHTLKATYAGDTAPVQFASSFGTDQLTINRPPTADNQSVSVAHNTPKIITLTGSDVDTNPLTFAIVSGGGPSHGTLSAITGTSCTGTAPAPSSCSANVTYTPTSGYDGPDSFTFKTNDGFQDSSAATVSITVAAKSDQTITFGPLANKTYGDADFTVSATASSGLAVTFTASGDCTISGNTVHITAAGSCTITAHQAGDSNYNPAPDVPRTFTIGQKAASVTADNKSKTYGDDNPALTVTVTGTVNGDTLNYTLATTALKFSNVGNYPITVTLGSNPNYNVSKTDGTLSIGQKAASVTADNKSKTYGDDNPALTATVTGTVNGDSLNYTLSTTALKFSNVGNYPITVTLGSNPNYNVSKTDGTLSIGQKAASVTADNKSKTYGDDNPTLTATVTGTVNGDSLNYTLATTALKFSNVGNYPITVSLGSNPNYSVTPANGTLSIGQKLATVTADNKSKTYGDDNPALTATVVGEVSGGAAINYSLATTALKFSNVGNYPITVSLGSNPNYNVTPTNGTLSITQKNASVTADNKSKTYGDDNPALTATVTGTVNGGTLNYSLATTALKFSNVGNYPITVTLGSNPNYNVSKTDGTLSIGQKLATVTANNKYKTYGDDNPPLTATVFGTVNGDTLNYTLATTALKFSNVGNYPITVSLGSNPNYDVTPFYGTLAINQKSATVTADNKSKTYGDDNPTLTATVTGTVNGDTLNYTLATTALKFSNVGNYPITVTLGSNPNYAVTPTNGTLSIGQKSATVTADNKTKTYGDDNPALTATVTGTVNGDTLNYSLATTAGKFSNVGNYPITVSLGSNPNYDVTPFDGTLEINQKSATVTADNKTKTYGDDNPALTATVAGTVNGDTLNYTLATTAGKFSNVGNYPITVSLGSNPNYSVTPANGTLTIGQKSATVTADNKTKTYGDDNPALTASVAGTVNGDTLNYSLATTATKFSNVGNYPITVTLGSNPNYNVSKTDGTLTINQKLATVTADPKSKTYGDDNPTLTATVVGEVVGGDAINYSLATTALKFSNVGNYPITVTLGSNPNYNVSKTDGTLTIGQKTASVTADPKSKTYGDDNPTLTATVTGTVNGDVLNYSLATTAVKFSNVGNYPITVSTGSNPNYNVTPTNGTLTIGQKSASVTATDKSKTYGDDNPALTATVTGTVNGDVLNYSLATTAVKFSNVGNYPITVTLGSNPNYDVSKTNGTLTINQKSASVTADNKSKTYGDDNPSLTATVTGTVNGDTLNYSLATTALKFSNVGNYPITVTLGSNPNYNVSKTDGTLTVTKASQTITFAQPADKYYGDGSITVSATGGGSGNDVTFSASPASVCTSGGTNGAVITFVGVGTCAVTASQAGNSNYYAAPDVTRSFSVKQDPTLITLDTKTSGTDFECANTYTATLKDTITNQGIGGVVLKLTLGTQGPVTATTDSSGKATFTLTLNQLPGVVTESVALNAAWTDANRIAPAAQSRSFTVNPSPNIGPAFDAATLYTGSRFFWTTSATSSTATLTLTTTIRDNGLCAGDLTSRGDVTKARVSFAISSNDMSSWTPVSNGQNLPVGLVDPNDKTVGAASVISQFNLNKVDSQQLWVKITVGGEYVLNSDVYDVPVTIAKPGVANRLLAAGTLGNDGSSIAGPAPNFFASGFLGAGNGTTTGALLAGSVDFGGQVIYSKSGINPQGQLTLAIHSWNKPDGTQDGQQHQYWVKSNSIASLVLVGNPGARTASFSSKTNVYDLTGTKVGLDGGGTMQFMFTEPGGSYQVSTATGNKTLTCPPQPGNTSGCASVIVFKSTGGVWFTSAWGAVQGGDNPQTVEKVMKSGGTLIS